MCVLVAYSVVMYGLRFLFNIMVLETRFNRMYGLKKKTIRKHNVIERLIFPTLASTPYYHLSRKLEVASEMHCCSTLVIDF